MTRSTPTRFVVGFAIVALSLIASGCSSADEETQVDASTPSTSSVPADDAAQVSATSDAETTISVDGPSDQPEPMSPAIAGLDLINILTPSSGGGERPLLEWEPVSGASRYMVTVYGPSGEAVWSTVTSTTAVYVGGPKQIPTANSGPRITDGSTWVVFADDVDGLPIAASGYAEINP